MTPAAHDLADDDTGLLSPFLADGRPLLTLGTLGLLFSGGFALFLAATGQFLPHDSQYLGMTARELCGHDACRIVHFMIHDRVSFGGTLLALSVLYLWLIHFPLRARRPWAWWTLLASNVAGFSSFLTYLGFGYLDTWHGVATLVLLPCFAAGLARSYRTLDHPRGIACLFRAPSIPPPSARARWGRRLLLATAAAMAAGGLTISVLGMTRVFVPQDLAYLQATAAQLDALNPRLIPLIAHDRAGFGGGVLNVGLLVLGCAGLGCAGRGCAGRGCAGRGTPSRHLWQALALAGAIGFGTAIGIHPLVGYNNPIHLAPACVGAASYFLALILMRPAR